MSIATIIWIGIFAALFVYLWRAGQLTKIRDFVTETREELKKCTWPTWNELKGSTVVVMISIFLLGGFTVAVDQVFGLIMRIITPG